MEAMFSGGTVNQPAEVYASGAVARPVLCF